jgi:flagellar hook-associated protein 1 FlgK
MNSYSIGISGLNASQRALDVIGNNIGNSATDGYHKENIELTENGTNLSQGVLYGGGVDVEGVSRVIDTMLEQEITHQQSSQSQVDRELSSLQDIESSFGDIDSNGLGQSLTNFFGSMQDLSVDPTDTIYQQNMANAADSMCKQFNSLGTYLDNAQNQVSVEASGLMDQINSLITKIAQYNGSIEDFEIKGGNAANLEDQRDSAINDLSQLIGIQTINRDNGVVDVICGGTAVVCDRTSVNLDMKQGSDGKLGISPVGDDHYVSDIQGGSLAGLFALYNDDMPAIQGQLNTLAGTIAGQVNSLHVQGVGTAGSFTSLTGSAMVSQNLSDFVPPVTNGTISIRVTAPDGTITRSQIAVSTGDTLSDIAAKFSQVTGITGSVSSGQLHIQAQSGYKFDFLPGALSTPTTSNLTGTAAPSISGIYTGSEDKTYTFKFVGSGDVGVTNGLTLDVNDADGNLVQGINIGQGYAAGDKVQLADGLYVSISAGSVNDGEQFTSQAIANSDTSGLLAAAGINTFFTGNSATSLAVSQRIMNDPETIASACGPELTDNQNINNMAAIADQKLSALGNQTAAEYYSSITGNLGQKIKIATMDQTNYQNIVQNLTNQRDSVSGVDINDQAAQMLIYQRMFQASSKYMETINTTMDTLMQIIK